jgi:hypothetical protein
VKLDRETKRHGEKEPLLGIIDFCVAHRNERYAPVHHVELSRQGEAVKQFFLALPVNPEGAVVELDGHALARVLPLPNGAKSATLHPGPWTSEKNARRCELVDREIDGILTSEEVAELQVLQQQFFQERRRLAPIPLKDLRELHDTLLAKAQKAAGRGQ